MLERHTLLCRLVEKLETIRGRTRFQKMLFIAKELGYPISENFAWGNYGVYSADLQSELDFLASEGFLQETDIGSEELPQFQYTIGENGSQLLRSSERLASEDDEETFPDAEQEGIYWTFGNKELQKLEGFLQNLNDEDVPKLELWSSILYLQKSQRDRENLISFLSYLKPKFNRRSVEAALDSIQNLEEWRLRGTGGD